MDNLHIDNIVFSNIKVAITQREQSIGLMYKEWPPPIMVFPFKNAQHIKFWMKNTPSPLDVIFCRGGRIIGIYQGEPNSTELFGPNTLSDLVIEMPKGHAQKYGIKVGSHVEMKYSGDTILKLYKNS
jgi:uncharacterized membrane protein (UPF0127 family)